MKYIKQIYKNIVDMVRQELHGTSQMQQDKYIVSQLAKQTREVSVGFLEWSLSTKHCWDYNDAFCIGENKNKWHDDNGTFITHEQLFMEYLKYLEEQRKFNLV